MPDKFYAVFCLAEVNGSTIAEGKYMMATSKLFRDRKEAEEHARPIALERWAVVWNVSDHIRIVTESLDRIRETNE